MSASNAGAGAPDEPRIVRYTAGTRINHWIVAISFVLLALSGLALFHPALFWLTNLFGGGPWTRILHPFVGCIMVAAFFLLGVKFWRDNYLQRRDWIWLRQINDVINNREENLPDVGRYNAGQKLLFFTIVACLIGLLPSGVVIWRVYFSEYFPIGVIRIAALLHAFCAFVLICAIIVPHLRGHLGQGIDSRDDPRLGFAGLGVEAPSRVVP